MVGIKHVAIHTGSQDSALAQATVFFKGCRRVGWMVSNNDSFRLGLAAKAVDAGLDTVARSMSVDGSKTGAIESFVDKLLSAAPIFGKYDVSPADILYFGSTRNNVREFDFLAGILSEHGLSFAEKRFQEEFSFKKGCATPGFTSAFKVRIKDDVSHYLHTLPDVWPEHLFQLRQYVLTYIRIRCAYAINPASLPSLAVVANDHSASTVAFMAAMMEFNVPVAYVQHAEVTHYFPALDFDISILRNEISRDIYRAMGPLAGKVHIASRRESHALDRVCEPLSNPVVGIYPTTRFDVAALASTVAALANNTSIGGCFTKLHPNASTRLTDEQAASFRVAAAIPETRHVGLVGNSSVVSELLAAGNPVCQAFFLDELQPDYYGFVESGLVPSVTLDALTSRFWDGFYTPDWKDRAALFEPALREDQAAVRSAIAEDIRSTIADSRARAQRNVRFGSRGRALGYLLKSVSQDIKQLFSKRREASRR
jgi:hypothetical protein